MRLAYRITANLLEAALFAVFAAALFAAANIIL